MTLGAFSAMVVAFALFSMYASARLEGQLRALRQRGAPTKLSDLAPKISSPERNAAPIYEQAFAAMVPAPRDDNSLYYLLSPPPPPSPQPPEMQGMSGVAKAPTPAATETHARSTITRNAQALALLHRAAELPEYAAPVTRRSLVTINHRYSRLDAAVALLAAAALLAAKDGRAEDSAEYLLDAVRVSELPANELLVIAAGDHLRMLTKIARATAQILTTAPPNGRNCRRLSDRLASLDELAIFARELDVQRTQWITYFDDLREATTPGSSLRDGLGDAQWLSVPRLPRRPFIDLFEALALERYSRVATDRGQGALAATSGAHSYLERELEQRDTGIAVLSLMQAALGLEAYKTTYRAYPESLSDLKTKLRWPLRDDPFSGKDLVYRRQGATYLLYSIGPNPTDDSGQKDPARPDDEQDDVVWGKI